jgi:peptide/nickel transport system substrate-binding protein
VPAPAAPAPLPGSTPKYGGSVAWPVRSDPRGGFDPHLPGGRREAREVFGVAYDYVAIWDTPPGEPCDKVLRPDLAESWRFSPADPLTLEVKLRQGVKFHNKPPVNGRELVAEDVKFSYERLFEKGLQKLVGDNISSMEAVDKYTLRIKTKKPAPLIPYDLFARYEAVVIAKEAGQKGEFAALETAIGTGPFVLESYTPGVGHVAKRNPDYRVKGLPYLDEVRFPIMRDKGTRVAALRVGKVDFLEDLTLEDKESLLAGRNPLQFLQCTADNHVIYLRNDIPPFNDVRLRRAFSMGLDREGIIKGIFRGEAAVIGVSLPDIEGAVKFEQFPAEVRKYLTYNPSEAKKLLAEAGYPSGLDVVITASLHHGPPFTNQTEALPAILRPAGFNVKMNIITQVGYQDLINTRGYSMAMVASFSTFPPEQNLTQNVLSTAGINVNRGAINDREADRLAEKILTAFDHQERLEALRQLQLRMVDQAFLVRFPAFFEYYGISARVKGNLKRAVINTYHDMGLILRDVWVEK